MKLDPPSPTAEQLTELHERLSELVRQLPAGFTVKQAASTAQGRNILLAWKRKYNHPTYEPMEPSSDHEKAPPAGVFIHLVGH